MEMINSVTPETENHKTLTPMNSIEVPIDNIDKVELDKLDLDIYQHYSKEQMKERKLEDIKNQCSELISELDSDQDPEAIVKKHISKLRKYNELKGIALGLVTMIADQRKLRTTDILEEMKVELSDY